MKKSKFSETQMVAIQKMADAGMPVKEVCRKAGISEQTYYVWKSKYGGMEASDLKRFKELEAEHSKLKRMYADLAMENHAMKDLIARKLQGRTPSDQRPATSSRRTVCPWPGPAAASGCHARPTTDPRMTGRFAMCRSSPGWPNWSRIGPAVASGSAASCCAAKATPRTTSGSTGFTS